MLEKLNPHVYIVSLFNYIFLKKSHKKTKTTNHDLSSKCNKNFLVVRTVLVFVGFFWGGVGGVLFLFLWLSCICYMQKIMTSPNQ